VAQTEWTEYSIAVERTGVYDLSFRVSNSRPGGKFHATVDGADVTGALTVPDTDSFDTFALVTQHNVALSAGLHPFRVYYDTAAQGSEAVGGFDWVTFSATAVAPVLTSIVAGDGTAQRSQVQQITLAFDRPVSLAAGAAQLALLNSGGSGTNDDSPPTDASAALGTPTTSDNGKTWVYRFAGGNPFMQMSGGNPTGSLIDGIYRLTVDPTKVTGGGIALAAGASLTFHRLFGDINGSKGVNAADYNAFRGVFGKTSTDPAYNAAFDFDSNGSINAADYNQFRSRFGKSLVFG
jgi:hypothetical protein